jgi:hypothetical protein
MTSKVRTWQFHHPDLHGAGDEPTAAPAGLALSPQGAIALVGDAEAIRQAILLLISTAPGERVMRPDYGCDLRWLVFAPNDDATAGLAIHYVRRALERYEPRIEIVSLDAGSQPERPQRLEIALTYRIRATQQLDHLNYSLQLTGEEA